MTIDQLLTLGVVGGAVGALWKVVMSYIDFLRDRLEKSDQRDADNLAVINRLADGVERLADQVAEQRST